GARAGYFRSKVGETISSGSHPARHGRPILSRAITPAPIADWLHSRRRSTARTRLLPAIGLGFADTRRRPIQAAYSCKHGASHSILDILFRARPRSYRDRRSPLSETHLV